MDEQALLEQLLEQGKPPPRPGSDNLHYLLMTPFRYPPLRHGSRFGRRHEPSIFYGAHRVETVLAEAAFYRLVFLAGMASAPPRPIRSQHTLFSAAYRSTKGLQLHQAPFDRHRALLTNPVDYAATQRLGSAMRRAGALAFEFRSARDRDGGINVGLFQPSALASNRPDQQEPWFCEVDHQGARFHHLRTHRIRTFPRETFLVNGHLPTPTK